MDHFEAVHRAQGQLGCPNCGAERWHIVALEAGRLDESLARAVEARGGRIDRRYAATPQSSSSPALPHGLRLVVDGDLPDDGRPVGPGISARRTADGTLLYMKGMDAPLGLGGDVRAASPAHGGDPVLLEVQRAGESLPDLMWLHQSGQRGLLPNPLGAGNSGPCFVDRRRFIYLMGHPGGTAELREGTLEAPDLVRTRRVGLPDRYVSGPSLGPVTFGAGRYAAVLRREHNGQTTVMCVSLGSGRAWPMCDPGERPRALAAARLGDLVVWQRPDGRLFAAGPDQPAVELGHGTFAGMAVAPKGDRVAWSDGEAIVIAYPGAHDVIPARVPSPADVTALVWD